MNRFKKALQEFKEEHLYPEISKLTGRTLEVGFGKGENFPYYSSATRVNAIDIATQYLDSTLPDNIVITKADCQNLPFKNDTFDNVVIVFTLCSVQNADKSILEIKRVTKKNGKIIVLEHIKSPKLIIRIGQKLMTLYRTKIINKCSLIRNPYPELNKFCSFQKRIEKEILLDHCVFVSAIKSSS